jgi:hypothetical protein
MQPACKLLTMRSYSESRKVSQLPFGAVGVVISIIIQEVRP